MPKVSNTLLFPVVDPGQHQRDLVKDTAKKGITALSDHDFCEVLSGIWAWNEDKTESVLADSFNTAVYYYYVSVRNKDYGTLGGACHANARSGIRYRLKTTVPIRYWDAFSSSKSSHFDSQPTEQIIQKFHSENKKYNPITGYTFEDFVRFYTWYFSNKNPVFKRFSDLMEVFEIHRTVEGYPVGFTCQLKSSISWEQAYTTVGLFLCMSRFLSEGFEQNTTSARRELYQKLVNKVEDYVLYPVVEAYTTGSTSHRWFHQEKIDLDLWFENSFVMDSKNWTLSFGTNDLPSYMSYLRSKGFMK